MSDTRLCKHCAHYDQPIDGTCCQGCIRSRDRSSWRPILKFKVGDRVRMVKATELNLRINPELEILAEYVLQGEYEEEIRRILEEK